ncbi:hypothetical protein [Flavobacterium gilvum]|uniref:Uncharacterized protein n=1 Tax=Flavobacterium gilvum TaxID=1492737 RepID=A0AAC9I1S0_9FLAO|nr:hypothetical protein [Flavobacterium gilvum]AOW08461.1 hypothetical protein EM308_02505 [Flavobacterium gilvum]KFC58511.1 hypothetical protein FEM08_27240 [Flavobacterium gilvum]
MKKAFLKKLLIAFSSLALLIYGTIYACADGDWGWAFDSNFAPETFVDKSYAPLFLSSDFFYGIGHDTEHTTRFNSENIKDWSDYLEGKIKEKDLAFFLTDSSSADVANLVLHYKNGKSNKLVEKWNKKIELSDSKIKDFVLFLNDAQIIETYSTQKFDSWYYDETVKHATLSDDNWIKSMEKKYNDNKDPFLKNRYWFLVIKSNFYSNKPERAITFFNQTQKSAPKNTLYYRALAYIAGIEYKQKNYAKSNYLYSQVFDKCPTMRVVSAYCFHPQEQKDWKQSLAMAKSDDEKAALWAIQGYYNDEEKAIAEIYKLQPKNPHLDYLLTRLINNQENKIDRDFKDKTVAENKKRTKDSIAKSTINLVSKIAESDKTLKPYLWNVAAGYLETLNGNFKQADKNFDKAESKIPQTPLAINQVRLLRFVNNLSKIDQLTPENEKTILVDLSWLYFELPGKNIENFRSENATSWSKSYLAALYRNQKNTIMAEIFNHDPGFFDNEKQLFDMKAFLSKTNKTKMEEIGSATYEIKLRDIYYFQGVKATFENKIPEAIAFMNQSDNMQKTVFYGNPFLGNIKDCHDCDHQATQKKKITILEFLTTIQKMQNDVAKKTDVYNNSILLGNAFYNITHFGNGRIFYESKIAGSGSTPDFFRDPIRNMITDCTLAKAYYQKAFAAAKNNEQKAKAQYMLSKCERNDYYNKKYYSLNLSTWDIQDDKNNFVAWQGFKNLRANYFKTKYYKEVINECGYFKTYVNK